MNDVPAIYAGRLAFCQSGWRHVANFADSDFLPRFRRCTLRRMIILSQTGGVAMTNSFLIADETRKEAVLFDAPDHTTGPLLAEVERRGWTLLGLWLTHGHFDHFADHAVVTRKFPAARILIHALDAPKLLNPDLQTGMFGLPFSIPPRRADQHVVDNQELFIGGLKVQVLHTPGHCSGSICLYERNHGILFTGDTILAGGTLSGILGSGNISDYINSLERLSSLRIEEFYPGHGRISTCPAEDIDKALYNARLLMIESKALFDAIDTKTTYAGYFAAVRGQLPALRKKG